MPAAAAHAAPERVRARACRGLVSEAHGRDFVRCVRAGHHARWPRLVVARRLGRQGLGGLAVGREAARSCLVHEGYHALAVAPPLWLEPWLQSPQQTMLKNTKKVTIAMYF